VFQMPGLLWMEHCSFCRPGSVDREPWYTSYKKLHGFKFQAISTADGLAMAYDFSSW
jgi:hypothetical protein